jgi:hypothetical protein
MLKPWPLLFGLYQFPVNPGESATAPAPGATTRAADSLDNSLGGSGAWSR